MNISNAGQKRVCAHCQARFFDLNRDPIVCPMCQAELYVPPPPPPRPVRGPRKFTPFKPAVAEAVDEDADFPAEKEKDDEDVSGEVLILDEEDESDAAHVEVAIDPEKRDRET
jgi:uncharacterized protein (TIGR02300 family)